MISQLSQSSSLWSQSHSQKLFSEGHIPSLCGNIHKNNKLKNKTDDKKDAKPKNNSLSFSYLLSKANKKVTVITAISGIKF